MSEATNLNGIGAAGADAKVIGLVSAAHFVSHFYLLLLPPLFAFIRADYGVSYTELGLVLGAFSVATGVCQTPAGFMVDRFGALGLLVGGLTLGSAAVMVAGLIPSYWVLLAAFTLAGVGNAVFHPADYALLSRVTPERTGHAFSIHTFAGLLGSAAAPTSLLVLQGAFGWRGALIASSVLGFAAAALLVIQRQALADPNREAAASRSAPGAAAGETLRLLMAPAIIGSFLFFVLLSIIITGLQFYSVVALAAIYRTPLATANLALTAYLLLSAIGVLVGGVIAARTAQHGFVAALGLALTAAMSMLVGTVDLGAVLLVLAMALGGFFNGAILPSRDMTVRAVTPPGSFGRVFGFVTTGFNIAGVIAPPVFGALMDHGLPRAVFFAVAGCGAAAILTVTMTSRQRRA